MSGEERERALLGARQLVEQLRMLQRLYQQRAFPKVVLESRRLLSDHPGAVPVWLLKALSIAQLDDANADMAPWGEEKEALLLAAEIDPLSTSAMIELASYLFASESRSAEALELFKRSITLSRERLRRSYVGAIKCLMDLAECDDHDPTRIEAGRSAAVTVLDEAMRLFPNDDELEEIRDYYKLF
ncbi:MAG: hypothetical protein ACREM3_19895 [Candidatus Rokuibacteriota bacterium]